MGMSSCAFVGFGAVFLDESGEVDFDFLLDLVEEFSEAGDPDMDVETIGDSVLGHGMGMFIYFVDTPVPVSQRWPRDISQFVTVYDHVAMPAALQGVLAKIAARVGRKPDVSGYIKAINEG